MNKMTSQKARDAAFGMLSSQGRTCSQIYNKLILQGFDEEIASGTVAKLCDDGYLDDVSFARNLIEQRLTRKPYGPRYLLAVLYRAGIDKDVAIEAVGEMVDQARENELAAMFIRSITPNSGIRPEKVMRQLLNRGFTIAAARRAMEEELSVFD
jgi:regulatory protein